MSGKEAPLVTFLLQGLIIGFSINAPIGPIGIFCIRRTLADGLFAGLLAGFGAAVADGIFGTIAALTVHQVAKAIERVNFSLSLVGGILLLAFAVWILLRPPTNLPAGNDPTDSRASVVVAVKAFFAGLGFTIINPLTILLFIAIFAGIDPHATLASMLSIVLGLFLSAWVCWTILALLMHFVRMHLGKSLLTLVNVLSAVAVAGYGIWAIIAAFHH